MSEQELRDRLHASVDSVEPPRDLAARAERCWRRRRRNAVTGAALAVLAVAGVAVVALPRSAPAPVVATPPPVEEGCVELPAPAAAVPAATPAGWTYRGDPALKARTLALAPAGGRATARPLLGLRAVSETSPNAWVFALAVPQPSGWHVRIGVAEEHDGRVMMMGDVLLPLPRSGPVSAFVSLSGGFFAGPAGGALVVLGPAGTERIEYAGCRDGRTFVTGSNSDTLVLTTGPLEEPGRLTVRAGGRVVSTGRPQDIALLPLAAPGSLDVSGYGDKLADAEVRLVGTERSTTVRFPGNPPRSPAVVLGLCRGRGSVLFEGTALPCDGRTHEVWTGTINREQDVFAVTGAPDPATGRTSLSVALAVMRRP